MMMIIIINYFINFFGCSLDFWTWLYAWLPMTLGHILYRYEKNNVFFFLLYFQKIFPIFWLVLWLFLYFIKIPADII